MKHKKYWVESLGLSPHPEGGFYKEIYRSDIETTTNQSNQRIRSALTSIYFLLGAQDKSHFHILQSDEIWYYHAGYETIIHFITSQGEYYSEVIGPENFQVVIPANTHFAAEIKSNDEELAYILVGCSVGPGFDFQDFQLSNEEELLDLCPDQKDLVSRLCLSS